MVELFPYKPNQIIGSPAASSARRNFWLEKVGLAGRTFGSRLVERDTNASTFTVVDQIGPCKKIS
jgi:hypothetical protein